MKLITITTLFFALGLFGYSQQTNESMLVGGVTRTYVQYLPVGFNASTESLPVIIVLHGLGDNAANMTNAGFKQIGDTARFLSLYPQGSLNPYSQTSWNNGTLLSSTTDDVSFIDQLIYDAITNYNADPERIYVTGFSMGSIMSYHLACALNNKIAAIGTMSGTMSTSDIANCVPNYATPVMHVHGTADATVPYNTGALPSLSLVPQTLDFWRNVHGCATTADSTRIPDTAADGLTVDRLVYNTCSPASSLELWRVNGGGHDFFYQPLNDFTESVDIWMFFRQWSNQNASLNLSEEKIKSLNTFPNPSNGIIHIESPIDDEMQLFSSLGDLILSKELNAGKNSIDLSSLSKGFYMIRLKENKDQLKRIIIQ